MNSMTRPFFYIDAYDDLSKDILLQEETSRHIVQVLRMGKGDSINLTDGRGHLLSTVITDNHKKHCAVKIDSVVEVPRPPRRVAIGISLLKTASRFEWFLEKATEIGVQEIIPLQCRRTEKDRFRQDRLQGILISAMLQSQQCWLPVLHEPVAYELLFRQEDITAFSQKFVAHCLETDRKELRELVDPAAASQLILIGPEGDFTREEIDLALNHYFIPVTLGNNRLRAETAGMVAATILRM